MKLNQPSVLDIKNYRAKINGSTNQRFTFNNVGVLILTPVYYLAQFGVSKLT